MPSKSFVKEIKADKIKDLNPSDIIYLAMKDGSIILVADNNEELVDYSESDDILGNSFHGRINQNYFSGKYKKKFTKGPTSHSIDNFLKIREKELIDTSLNIGEKNYETDFNIKYPNNSSIEKIKKSHFFHKIEYFGNNNMNTSFKSNKTDYMINRKINKSCENFKFGRHHRNNSSKSNDFSIDNKLKIQPIEKINIYRINEDTYNNINSFNIGKQDMCQNYKDNNLDVKTKEMQIMGKIINHDNSYKLIDHKHPHTLYDPSCKYCQNLSRKNKLCLSHIKEESIQDNHSFTASFENSNKKGNHGKMNNNYSYKII